MTIARRRRRYAAMWREVRRKERLAGRCYSGEYTPAEQRLITWEEWDWLRRFRKRLDTRSADRAG